jgi:hypothetical protein
MYKTNVKVTNSNVDNLNSSSAGEEILSYKKDKH